VGSLEGKVGLVTGGASGIGRAVVTHLAKAGASVMVADVDEAGGAEVAESVGGAFVRTDVTDPAASEVAVAETLKRFGRLDVAHLNAGVITGESDIERLSVEAYRRAVGINLDGVVYGTMAAVPAMSDGGAIIATASLAGLVAYPGDPIYAVTKHAVVGFVRSMGEQLEAKRITVNAICPGFVDTQLIGPFAEEFRKAGFPLLSTDDVAEAVLEVIDSGLTGQVFVVQPGLPPTPYKFRGVPGARAEGTEGMAPPVYPSV
jgi:NAD(P)-dependent dehydrogenase (short-subunit alcohol dehydrogenase family)